MMRKSTKGEDALSIDMEDLNRMTTLEQFQEFYNMRLMAMENERNFKNEIQSCLDVADKKSIAATQIQRFWRQKSKDVLNRPETSFMEKKRIALRKFIKDGKIDLWTVPQLFKLFNTFGILSSPLDQIALYERTTNEEFKKNPLAWQFYAQALRRVGRISDAIHELKSLLFHFGDCDHGEASNYLGDAYMKRYEAANHILKILEIPPHQIDWKEFEGARKRYELHFPASYHSSVMDKRVVTLLREKSKKKVDAYPKYIGRESMDAYSKYFGRECSHEPILRSVETLVNERSRLSTRIAELQKEISEIEKQRDVLSHKIDVETDLAEIAIVKQGGPESHDFWLHSGLVEVAVLKKKYKDKNQDNKFLKSCLNGLFRCTRAPHQLKTTMSRVRQIGEGFKYEEEENKTRIQDVCEKLRIATESLEATGKIDPLKDEDEEEDSLGMSGPNSSVFKTSGLSFSVCAQHFSQDTDLFTSGYFLSRTFSMRGLITSPRPYFIPGGLSLMGGRVPDMIFSPADKHVFGELLRRWDLVWKKKRAPTEKETNQFLIDLMSRVRQIFRTHELQALHSPTHTAFDEASDSVIEFVGIPLEFRKGTDCSTNCSAALLFFGDCREHAIEMLAFFDYWQNQIMNSHLKDMRRMENCLPSLLRCSSPEEREEIVNDFQENIKKKKEILQSVLNVQLRGAHVGVYASVSMESKYKPVGWEKPYPQNTPLFRKYTIESVKKGEKLTPYEIANSFIICKDEKGQIIDHLCPKRETNWEIPNKENVPVLSDLCCEIELFNMIENHTMTFLCRLDVLGGLESVEMKDSFYNELFTEAPDESGRVLPPDQQSPYQFGSGKIDLDELADTRSFSAGFMIAQDEETKQQIKTPVRINLLPFSRRADSPSLSESGDIVRFIGMGLLSVDVVGELMREDIVRMQGLKSRRDELLDRLRAWKKSREKEEEES